GLAGDFGGAALDDHLRAFFDALFEIAEDAFTLLLVDDRAHLGLAVHLVADVDLLEQLRAFADEVVVHTFVYEPAGGVAADLAAVESDRADELRGGVADVDVFENDGSAFAAEFELDWSQVAAAGFGDHATDFG